jgi:hypothetical protein
LRNFAYSLLALHIAASQPAFAAELSLTGTFKSAADERMVTVKQITITQDKDGYHAHVIFYGRPDDIDLGSVPLEPYRDYYAPKQATVSTNLQQYAFLCNVGNNSVKSRLTMKFMGNGLNVDSYTDWKSSKPDHIAAHDVLVP